MPFFTIMTPLNLVQTLLLRASMCQRQHGLLCWLSRTFGDLNLVLTKVIQTHGHSVWYQFQLSCWTTTQGRRSGYLSLWSLCMCQMLGFEGKHSFKSSLPSANQEEPSGNALASCGDWWQLFFKVDFFWHDHEVYPGLSKEFSDDCMEFSHFYWSRKRLFYTCWESSGLWIDTHNADHAI